MANRGSWVGQICNRMLKNWKGHSRLMEGLALYYWPQVAGADLAAKTHADRMMAGTVWIRTNDPTLAHHLTFLVPKILGEYEKLMGGRFVRSVRFVIGQLDLPSKPSEIPLEKHIDLPMAIEESAVTIEDEKLRSTFLRTAQYAYQKEYDLRQKGWKPCSCGILTEDGSLCDDCRRREAEEKYDMLIFFMSHYPERSWEEAGAWIPNLSQDDWERARRGLRVKYESLLRTTALSLRKSRKKNIDSLIEPAKHYLIYGGNTKDLGHIIGIDLWNDLKRSMDDNN